MKELVVISGKGGTGKTSIVAALAAMVDKKVLADCDVDAPDLHLLLNPDIKRRRSFGTGKKAIIRTSECISCGECEDVCRYEAISHETVNGRPGEFKVDTFSCEGCGVCVRVCPVDAIDFNEQNNGEWYISDTRHGPMIHAMLGATEENSGKLVTIVRQQAARIAEEQELPLVIVDGPPGIGCPVIASIGGATAVLVVTEPTISGLHDMERVIKVADHFSVPTMICINKFDINRGMSEKIEEFANKSGMEIVGKIPYDPIVTKAQIEGKSIVEFRDTPASNEMKSMWERIKDKLA